MTNSTKLKVRRAEALRSAREAAAVTRESEDLRLAEVAHSLDQARGFLRAVGVTRLSVDRSSPRGLRDARVVVEVKQNHPQLGFLPVVAFFATMFASAKLQAERLAQTESPGVDEVGWVQAAQSYFGIVLQSVGITFVSALAIAFIVWALCRLLRRPRLVRVEVPLRAWASPDDELQALVEEVAAASELRGGERESNFRLVVRARAVKQSSLGRADSVFDRFLMERKRVRGA